MGTLTAPVMDRLLRYRLAFVSYAFLQVNHEIEQRLPFIVVVYSLGDGRTSYTMGLN